jgi:basic membrane protein A
MPKTALLRLVPGAAALVLLAAACGVSSSTKSAQTTTGSGSTLRVGARDGHRGLNDRGFNHLSYVGLQRAERKLGVTGRVLNSGSATDYIPNLSSLAKQGYDVVVGVGFLQEQAIQ